jgi:hypothetical protein
MGSVEVQENSTMDGTDPEWGRFGRIHNYATSQIYNWMNLGKKLNYYLIAPAVYNNENLKLRDKTIIQWNS